MTGEPDPTELAQLSDELLSHVRELKRHYRELIELSSEAPATGAARSQPAPTAASADNASEVMAIELALAGHSREEVGRRIAAVYGSEPAPEVLERVFRRLER